MEDKYFMRLHFLSLGHSNIHCYPFQRNISSCNAWTCIIAHILTVKFIYLSYLRIYDAMKYKRNSSEALQTRGKCSI